MAVRLALLLHKQGKNAVVINADSAQVYSDLRVLSARPSEAEMQGVEHRLYGTWDGALPCSAADWAAAAGDEVRAAHARGAVPILVGGTGLYIRTLIDGIAPVPPIDPQIREEVRSLPLAEVLNRLTNLDPVRACRLSPADSLRLRRALEVVLATGRTLDDWQNNRTGGIGTEVTLHPAILLPDRAWLYRRCETRFASMVQTGALEEVEALLSRGLDKDLPVMRAIGVREIARYLQGQYDINEALSAGAQATRNYVKRQVTWLRHQPPAEWRRHESETFPELVIFASLLHN